ncbi:glycosyltransferase [Methanofervidicoccus sp. A16]|uniref:glycosyltransferase family 2 protein n=1 Tax=Methanofervidicoccus sp. A16 TaxID=2607662 RepID=UPI00209BD960|nr:glycosyltransferase [Methanofervidicoccus sp. A16]
MRNPKISVVMATYRESEKYLRKSIESILNQTFQDFEFIIILDDPNNEKNEKLIEEYAKKDKRIVFLKNERNLGRGASRNRAIDIAKGKYVAIMDADDIALPERLEKQFNYLEENEDVDLLFTWAYWIDERDNIIGRFKPERYKIKNIKKYFFREHLLVHPSMMIKTEILKELKYNENLLRSQDYDLWIRCILNNYNFDVVEEFLLKYRVIRENIEKRIKKQINYSKYSTLILRKYKKYFYRDIYFWKVFFFHISMYIFLIIVPKGLIKELVRIKDKKQ